VYEKLRLNQENEKDTKAIKEASDTCGPSLFSIDYTDELVCSDQLTNELVSFGDWRNHVMLLESSYMDMTAFRLAMRQFVIKKEFELGIEATSTTRYRGYCKGGDCPWRIHTRQEVKGSPIIIVCFLL
jgi:hypothetical protein